MSPVQERTQIHEMLLAARPELRDQLQIGASGALLMPLPGGVGIEIGRMRRRLGVRWVVVVPDGRGAHVREAPGPAAAVAMALAAWERLC